ncbi:MAG TPA: hypothetical protein PLW77_00460 [Bacteroidales bacterium]|nr:hypothetical protein [Bacteroidales bacterium]HQB21286.1 hypothetical protein [Bacteroidales bacterium]
MFGFGKTHKLIQHFMFNDVLLTITGVENFNIIADNERESKFGREIRRPTFKQNKLIDKVTFFRLRKYL